MAKIKKGAADKQPVTIEDSLPLFLKAGTGSVSLTVRAKPGSKVRSPSPYHRLAYVVSCPGKLL
jgi:hypothetical protein